MSNILRKISKRKEKYKAGLTSLATFGLDLIVISKGIVFTYKEHSYFDEEKKNLPIPCKFGENLLSEAFMEQYHIITKVDIARLLRIISIILTNFKGSKEKDSFDIHIENLQNFFQFQLPFDESIMAEVLGAYDEAFGIKNIILLGEYIAFARVLNLLYYIFKKVRKIEDSTSDEDFDEMFAYRFFFKDFTKEKMRKMFKNEEQIKTIRYTLEKFKLTNYEEHQLERYVNNPSKFDEFFQILKEWSDKTFSE